MITTPMLDGLVGKSIQQICGNKFHSPTENHCAHFVSHVCGLGFSYHCRQHKGGTKPGANIRVHEVFEQCPKVGPWSAANPAQTQLIFVTAKSNVDVSRRWLGNIPEKHIGIYHGGKVYHYSNGRDQVTTDTPDSFLAKFEAQYSGTQGIWFGLIPGSDLELDVKPLGLAASAERKFDLPEPVDKIWKARETGQTDWFVVGKEINKPADKYHGLFVPASLRWGPTYRAADYTAAHDHWAVLLEISGACESENCFTTINTYDRAKFTFGFYQLAAHTPHDNLILLFHALAALPAFKGYFPDLQIVNGRLTRIDASGTSSNLETEFTADNGEQQLMLFMNYLNPRRLPIDRQEVLMAARLMHWAANDAHARHTQVSVAARILQSKMAKRHAPALGLDGQSDVICAIVADIFHQGRSKYATVKAILESGDPVAALLTVNDSNYATRNRRLKRAVEEAIVAGTLGQKRYSLAQNGFV